VLHEHLIRAKNVRRLLSGVKACAWIASLARTCPAAATGIHFALFLDNSDFPLVDSTNHKTEAPMALWKETTENAHDTTAPEQSAPAAPAVPTPAPPPKVTTVKERHESFFGPGVTIEGRIEGDANVRIGGKFTGNIHIAGNLVIDRGARIAATINAETVSIQGELEGNIAANAQVALLESGQVIGDIKAATLTVAAGARMRGNVEFGWSKAESEKILPIRPHDKGKAGSVG
jgi:cytoskeletal protein CcmA (bactofilin family)